MIQQSVFTFTIEGMACNGCRSKAEKALQTAPGVALASVDLASKQARVEGHVSLPLLRQRIEELGFTTSV